MSAWKWLLTSEMGASEKHVDEVEKLSNGMMFMKCLNEYNKLLAHCNNLKSNLSNVITSHAPFADSSDFAGIAVVAGQKRALKGHTSMRSKKPETPDKPCTSNAV